MKPQIQIGTRSSRLALIQAESAREMFSEKFPEMKWEMASLSSPGDRDKASDLVSAPEDFFTRDLDDTLLAGTIDCAVHSAKDMPDPLPEGIDFFRLPNPADPRDVLVCRQKISLAEAQRAQSACEFGKDSPRTLRLCEESKKKVHSELKRIGVSSERRLAYAKNRFPNAVFKPLRGTIEERLAQLDDGAFDCIIMAAAALQRLGLEERITEWISAEDLPVPDGQGTLALTFRADDERFLRLRTLFVKPVVFVSAGTNAGLCTQAGVAALRRADVCLYDALLDNALLAELPVSATTVFVGKRSRKHSHQQKEICEMLTRFARQGKRVVRLKGGDAGLYGRLAEEVDALDAVELPCRVIPGVSSLSSATTGTGLLLTRRGTADAVKILNGYNVGQCFQPIHPRKVDSPQTGWKHCPTLGETLAVFMGIQSLGKTVDRLLEEGKSPDLPVSVVFNAGRANQQIISAPLSGIVSKLGSTDLPGLVLIGETADPKFLYRAHGALRGKRVWLTCSAAIQERSAQAILDFGGVPVQQPLIELIPVRPVSERAARSERIALPAGAKFSGGATPPAEPNRMDQFINAFDWLIVTSPSAVRCLMKQLDDLRTLPKILCCGIGTAKALSEFRIQADAMPEGEFNTQGVLEAARKHIPKDSNILRVRSDRAGETLSSTLRETFAQVEDVVICRNCSVSCEMPACDAVFFASVSAVESFVEQFGIEKLAGKELVVIGKMDAAALQKHGVTTVVSPKQSTVEAAVEALAASSVWKEMGDCPTNE